jgi:hypothetical protein
MNFRIKARFREIVPRFHLRFLARDAEHMHRRHAKIFTDIQVRPKVEMLEHHGKPGAKRAQHFALWRSDSHTVFTLHGNVEIIQLQTTLVGCFQEVDASQTLTPAGAARSNDAHHIACVNRDRNAFEDFVIAVAFVNVSNVKGTHGVKPCLEGLRAMRHLLSPVVDPDGRANEFRHA